MEPPCRDLVALSICEGSDEKRREKGKLSALPALGGVLTEWAESLLVRADEDDLPMVTPREGNEVNSFHFSLNWGRIPEVWFAVPG